ncbi:MAG: hypothetical protein AB1690_02445 [Candidatus Zixiibacteriota bacterium]
MANINKVVVMIQGKVMNFNADYRAAIEATIESAWSEMGDRHEWWFLRAGAPHSFSVPANTGVVTLGRDDIGRIIKIADSARKKKINFVGEDGYDASLNPADVSGSELYNTGVPEVAMLYGLADNGRKQLAFSPSPTESTTYYLHYCLKPTLGNLNRLPESHVPTLVHKVLSILAPPVEKRGADGYVWWKAVTKDEDTLYEQGLRRLIAQARPVTPPIPTVTIDPYLEGRLLEIDELP